MTKLPAIDWTESLKLANDKPELAEELLRMFMSDLHITEEKIDQYAQARDYERLLDVVHKMHGATCYCGVPQINATASKLETALKNNDPQKITDLVKQLRIDIRTTISAWVGSNPDNVQRY